MKNSFLKNQTAPDILSCLANLSNDEVFTPPEVVNQMLDLLPQELFANPETKFLDPTSKTGVFLREIAKRCLDAQMPGHKERSAEISEKISIGAKLNEADVLFKEKLQEKIDHILHNQVYGIAITELTSLLSRRSVYCSKYPNGPYSISHFNNADGNIRFRRVEHVWSKNGNCAFCGAGKERYSRGKALESYAYEFIHTDKPKEIFDMYFDVIIGNPPYQLTDSSDSASASPIYNLFVEQAKKLRPRYLSMIIPSRWMTCGKGLGSFRDIMIKDRHITKLHDFVNSEDCFSGVDIKGGVCYFLWERDRETKCQIDTYTANGTIRSERYLKEDGLDVFVRQPDLIAIKNKVWKNNSSTPFSSVVSMSKPYGLRTDFFKNTQKYRLPALSDVKIPGGYEVLGLVGNKRTWKYAPQGYAFPKRGSLNQYKVFIGKAYGCGALGEVPSTPVLGTPGQACTETFLELGGWNSLDEANNALRYLKTKFFRSLVGIVKQTQDASHGIYRYVPLQDFTSDSDIDWSKSVVEIDAQLYKKYNLSDEEIRFIEENITEMED